MMSAMPRRRAQVLATAVSIDIDDGFPSCPTMRERSGLRSPALPRPPDGARPRRGRHAPGGRVGRVQRHSTADTLREWMASSECSGTRQRIESEHLTKVLTAPDAVFAPPARRAGFPLCRPASRLLTERRLAVWPRQAPRSPVICSIHLWVNEERRSVDGSGSRRGGSRALGRTIGGETACGRPPGCDHDARRGDVTRRTSALRFRRTTCRERSAWNGCCCGPPRSNAENDIDLRLGTRVHEIDPERRKGSPGGRGSARLRALSFSRPAPPCAD